MFPLPFIYCFTSVPHFIEFVNVWVLASCSLSPISPLLLTPSFILLSASLSSVSVHLSHSVPSSSSSSSLFYPFSLISSLPFLSSLRRVATRLSCKFSGKEKEKGKEREKKDIGVMLNLCLAEDSFPGSLSFFFYRRKWSVEVWFAPSLSPARCIYITFILVTFPPAFLRYLMVPLFIPFFLLLLFVLSYISLFFSWFLYFIHFY